MFYNEKLIHERQFIYFPIRQKFVFLPDTNSGVYKILSFYKKCIKNFKKFYPSEDCNGAILRSAQLNPSN